VKTITVLPVFLQLFCFVAHASWTDHNLLMVPYHTTDDELTMDDIFHGKEDAIKRMYYALFNSNRSQRLVVSA
jgi:hypothetical protein